MPLKYIKLMAMKHYDLNKMYSGVSFNALNKNQE